MGETRLRPGGLYWARSANHFDGALTVVQVSDVFGVEPDYWTLALIGTDQHAMPDDFDIIAPLERLDDVVLPHAAE
jgi:hypothetical protein